MKDHSISYIKTLKVIMSCENTAHLLACKKMSDNFEMLYPQQTDMIEDIVEQLHIKQQKILQQKQNGKS